MSKEAEELTLTLSGFPFPQIKTEVIQNGEERKWSSEELEDHRTPVSYELTNGFDETFFIEQSRKIRSQAILVPDRALSQATGLKGKIKKFCAKLFRWYILPTAEDQNTYNVATYQMIVYMNKQMEINQQKIEELTEEMEILKGNR